MKYPDAWTCAYCGTVYVVPSLARQCEAKCVKYQAKESK